MNPENTQSLQESVHNIREWAPCTNIMDKIPDRAAGGLTVFMLELNITSIDANGEFVALGSNAGIVYWYNRETTEVQKLRAETTSPISCVKIVDSVEFMVAAGHANGKVSVFQIQKKLPPDLNLVAPFTRVKPIERYTIRDLHRGLVRCCEWSKNGMKLFTGDIHGTVVLTEFDYQHHLSKSFQIITENYEIVQLNVYRTYLLVSSLYRSIICQRNATTGKWEITQVGKKDRKQLSDCGGIFLPSQFNETSVICCRPGLRFWLADIEGNVQKTLLFKEAIEVHSPIWEIPILNPKTTILNVSPNTNVTGVQLAPLGDSSFFKNFTALQLYNGNNSLVVTHDESNLYILNLDRLCVEAVAKGFRRIIDFCVYKDEIFILEGPRSLLRLAPKPEKPNKTAKVIFNPSMPPPVPPLGSTSMRNKVEYPSELKPDNQYQLIKAEECFELPPVQSLTIDIPIELAVESPRETQNRRLEIFNQISEMDFDQSILHHTEKTTGAKKKRKKSQEEKTPTKVFSGIVEIGIPALHEDVEGRLGKTDKQLMDNVRVSNEISLKIMRSKELENIPQSRATGMQALTANRLKTNSVALITRPTELDTSFCNISSPTSRTEKLKIEYMQQLPDLLSPNTLKKTIEEKAKFLAKEMDLPEVRLEPITDEDLRASQALTAPPPPVVKISTKKPTTINLTEAYPQKTQAQPPTDKIASPVQDAGVQTTPRKKPNYLYGDCDEELLYDENLCMVAADYSAGQPVDEICHAMRNTAIASATIDPNMGENNSALNFENLEKKLQFVNTQPVVTDEIDSFLIDFRRAADPLQHLQTQQQQQSQVGQSPPKSSESTISSEWEFLNN